MAHDLKLESTWRDRVERQRGSGLSVTAFCDREALAQHQFYWWRRELAWRAAQSAKRIKSRAARKTRRNVEVLPQGFVPVRVTGQPRANSGIEIVLDQPVRIRVAQGFDPEVLVQLLRLLETRPC